MNDLIICSDLEINILSFLFSTIHITLKNYHIRKLENYWFDTVYAKQRGSSTYSVVPTRRLCYLRYIISAAVMDMGKRIRVSALSSGF